MHLLQGEKVKAASQPIFDGFKCAYLSRQARLWLDPQVLAPVPK
jgi:hypothetical protein